jgi:broad specificity phosphatase PhoE
MKFVIIRHTTTDWNLACRMQGQIDTELNEKGYEEAEELRDKLLNLNISKIVSSDLKRARKTAEIINEKLNAPLILDEKLRECSFGNLEGMTKSQAIEKYKESVIKHWDDEYKEYDLSEYGGENRNQVLQRHTELLDSLKKNSSENETILLVGHGRGIRTLLRHLGYEPPVKRTNYVVFEY